MLGLFKNQLILDELKDTVDTNINLNITGTLSRISNTILTDADYVSDVNSVTGFHLQI